MLCVLVVMEGEEEEEEGEGEGERRGWLSQATPRQRGARVQ